MEQSKSQPGPFTPENRKQHLILGIFQYKLTYGMTSQHNVLVSKENVVLHLWANETQMNTNETQMTVFPSLFIAPVYSVYPSL